MSALRALAAWGPLLAVLVACAGAPLAIEPRLQGDTVALLGEVHDNPEAQRLRLGMLQRAVAAGWRPAIAMEQFDIDRQADIDRARREAPRDAQHVIDVAAPAGSGWNWDFYRPLIALALDQGLPLLAANLSTADTVKIVRGGYASVFEPARAEALGLGRAVSPAWQAAQEREIDAGHCGMLPAAMWPAMVRAQFARDAVMAAVLREHGEHGVVLIAGNGHVRRDIGVWRWLDASERTRAVAIGFVEAGSVPAALPGLGPAFDAVVTVAPAPRPDPCEVFAKRPRH